MRKSFFLVPLLALAMSSCSSDEPANPGGETPDSKDGFYATISFKLPTGSRAESDKDGEEVGKDYENNIGSILVILAKADKTATSYSSANYEYVSYAYTDAPRLAGGTTGSATKKYTINFQDKESLFEYAGEGSKTVNVFAYCNPPQSLVDYVLELAAAPAGTDKVFTDQIMTADIVTTWNEQKAFLMTSAKMHDVVLPSQEDLKSKHNTPTNPFNLTEKGPIEVMRAAVRFDYKDGATAKDESNKIIPFTYNIVDINDPDIVQGSVTLTDVALFNLRDQFYYLPRTADATGAISLCPADIEAGHVVSPVEPANRTYSETIGFGNTAIDPSKNKNLKWSKLTTIIGGTEDNDGEWTHPDDTEGSTTHKMDYHIWRYASENTFAYDAETFDRNETTGVVFKAKINVDGDDRVEAGKPMYLYQGVLYHSAKQVYKAAREYPGTGLAIAFKEIFDVTGEGETATVSLKEAYKDALEAEGFTIYHPDEEDGNYYCYYYYFNKHNDDGLLEEIAPFEFATVRNNIYKLSVTKITQFATFFPPETIEDWNVFFSLDVEVRKWTVRVNDIEF